MLQTAHGLDHRLMSNGAIASALEEIADLLESQAASSFRIQAYHRGAATIRALEVPVLQILYNDGTAGLIRLPTIGRSLAATIDHLVRFGHCSLLDRLRGDHAAERAFSTVPTIGGEMARRIHETLGIEKLVELQAAANDGRLATVNGMGPKRIRAVRESLASRFRHFVRFKTPVTKPAADEVEVAEILDIDDEYRRLAKENKLPRIAPRRFNPTKAAWLPVLHTTRGDRHYSALYSNTARAHSMAATDDWVVIYRDDIDGQMQWTVITSQYGRLRNKRIVRGREPECLEYYADKTTRR